MNFRPVAVAAACLVLGLMAVPAMAQTAPAAQAQAVPLISVDGLKALMKSKQYFFLIDVRQPDEYAAGHIDGAVLMPLDKLPQTYRQIPKGVKLVVNCRSGHRSAQAVTCLLTHGYKNAVSLDGGYLAWTAGK
jgi:rhodanese-related sulfurtransferase